MSYSEKLASYRAEFKKHLEARDSSNARLYAILYAKLLREIGSQVDSYMDRARLSQEAEKYDVFAAMITKYGITDDVKRTVLSGDALQAPSAEKKEPKKPRASSAAKKSSAIPAAEAPSVSPAPPASLAASVDDADWGAEIFEKYLPAILVVRTYSGVGTGFFITPEGHFITNHHVVFEGSSRSSHITIESGDKKIKCEAEFINADKNLDVSLLK
ncbi:MAG: trypsin-like peptidase domain-containing protein, partial [Clostridia bacterium]|nr:trypsin-like peptidase domain-containing protein [Clostridia bacterium]